MADRFRNEPPVPDFAAQFRPPVAASRWHALGLVAIGIVALAANHGLVVVAHKKHFEIVFVGAVFLLIGIGGCVHALLILGARTAGRVPSLTSSCIGGVFVIAGVGLALWLWAVVYP
jgi:predicted lysophospholipase L1 biosynthesis ABC-type transport system permease subunit